MKDNYMPWLIDPNIILTVRHIHGPKHEVMSVVYESDLIEKGGSPVGSLVNAELDNITGSPHRVVRFVFTDLAEEFWI
jgi:hypothetical protein